MWKRAILCAFPVTYVGYSAGIQGKALEDDLSESCNWREAGARLKGELQECNRVSPAKSSLPVRQWEEVHEVRLSTGRPTTAQFLRYSREEWTCSEATTAKL
jgi:hypothetical protein